MTIHLFSLLSHTPQVPFVRALPLLGQPVALSSQSHITSACFQRFLPTKSWHVRNDSLTWLSRKSHLQSLNFERHLYLVSKLLKWQFYCAWYQNLYSLIILQNKILPLKVHHRSSPHSPFSLQIGHKHKEIYYFSQLSKGKVRSECQLSLTLN